MKRRSTAIGFLVLLPLGCCATSYVVLDQPWKNKNAQFERLRADADARLPAGSSRAQAEEWFASHNIRCSELIHVDTNRVVGLGGGIRDDVGLDTAEIAIEVRFDKQGRVSEVFIRRIVISL